jgi:hypothetical protein
MEGRNRETLLLFLDETDDEILNYRLPRKNNAATA